MLERQRAVDRDGAGRGDFDTSRRREGEGHGTLGAGETAARTVFVIRSRRAVGRVVRVMRGDLGRVPGRYLIVMRTLTPAGCRRLDSEQEEEGEDRAKCAHRR